MYTMQPPSHIYKFFFYQPKNAQYLMLQLFSSLFSSYMFRCVSIIITFYFSLSAQSLHTKSHHPRSNSPFICVNTSNFGLSSHQCIKGLSPYNVPCS